LLGIFYIFAQENSFVALAVIKAQRIKDNVITILPKWAIGKLNDRNKYNRSLGF
jgi:hypothetical protein